MSFVPLKKNNKKGINIRKEYRCEHNSVGKDIA